MKVTEPDSYIAWEFDVIVGDVLFCLLRAKSDAMAASAAKVTMVMEPQSYHEGEAIQVGQWTLLPWKHVRYDVGKLRVQREWYLLSAVDCDIIQSSVSWWKVT